MMMVDGFAVSILALDPIGAGLLGHLGHGAGAHLKGSEATASKDA